MGATTAPANAAEQRDDFHSEKIVLGERGEIGYPAARAVMQALDKTGGGGFAITHRGHRVENPRTELDLLGLAAGSHSELLIEGTGPRAQQIVEAAREALRLSTHVRN